MSAPEDGRPTLGVVRAQNDPRLKFERDEYDPKNDAWAPQYYTKGADGEQVPSAPPESLTYEERRRVGPIYSQWPLTDGVRPCVNDLHKRVLQSLWDAEGVNGLDSATGKVYPAIARHSTVRALVDGNIEVHEALHTEWPNACEIVDPRNPVAVVPSLGKGEDPLEVAHEAVVNGNLETHQPVPYDPDDPLHTADRLGLVGGSLERRYALRGAWRDYRTWVRDLAPGGPYAQHVSQTCSLARYELDAPDCAEHTGGQFLVVHRSRYLVVVPMCRFCLDALIERYSPESAVNRIS